MDYETAANIVRRLGEAPKELEGEDELAYVERVLTEEGCTAATFRELDARPGCSMWNGYAGLAGEWHYRLRRYRNRADRARFLAALVRG